MAQLLLTLDFMGRKGVIHRDLKPENILISSKEEGVFDLRIADFGFAMPLESTTQEPNSTNLANVLCGTPGYIAPEALCGKGFNLKSDVFSVGSILYSILSLKNLFNGDTYQEIMDNNRICNLKYIQLDLYRCSPESKDLLRLLLSKDPEKRPTAIQALAHPWFFNEKLPLQSSVHLNKVLASRSRSSMPRNELHMLVQKSIANANPTMQLQRVQPDVKRSLAFPEIGHLTSKFNDNPENMKAHPGVGEVSGDGKDRALSNPMSDLGGL